MLLAAVNDGHWDPELVAGGEEELQGRRQGLRAVAVVVVATAVAVAVG
eukprot:CAMPEP_0206045814 /NCGR_PEP_ID=MMETSP1466-20131121/16913_1 /ASSEMBLY_ACC=CAM_ASM_001126 /TAXON_ID=44452 /ORGANISM="Pavlova gyrans, Strain CCMP608" /LENGTH=47 /DNA_ID= /DNA_START= /DNA_END= /DNA_ORIENTATION=